MANDFDTSRLPPGRARDVADAIRDWITQRLGRPASGGGCRAFYSQAEWQQRGERWGNSAVLVLVHDGGDLAPLCNIADYPAGDDYTDFHKFLFNLGVYVETFAAWCSGVYPDDGTAPVVDDAVAPLRLKPTVPGTPRVRPVRPVQIRVGLPYGAAGRLAQQAGAMNAPTLISAGSLFRPGRGFRMGAAAFTTKSALDSAGFTAMMLGGYRWTVEEYVEFVCTNGGEEWSGSPFPWSWWSAMDFCVEPEIARDRAVVEERIAQTTDTYVECLAALEWWRDEGVSTVPDPMPILQGRIPGDYVRSAEQLARAIDTHHRCICPTLSPDETERCPASWHRAHTGLPELVGVGSVCRRNVEGPDGLLAVLAELDRVLPEHVQVHLFGVKGPALSRLGRYLPRVKSVDSMAWDFRARVAAREAGVSFSTEIRAEHMRKWFQAQEARGLATWRTWRLFDGAARSMLGTLPDDVSPEAVLAFLDERFDELWQQVETAA